MAPFSIEATTAAFCTIERRRFSNDDSNDAFTLSNRSTRSARTVKVSNVEKLSVTMADANESSPLAPAFLSLPPNTFKRVLDDTPLAGTSMEELRANWKQLTVEDIVCLLNSFAKVNAEPEPYFLCLLQNLPPKTFKRVLDDTPLAGTSIEVLQANWKQLKPAVVKRLFNSYVKQTSRNGFQRLLTYFHCGFNKKRNVERESSPPSVIIAEVPVLPTFVGETAILISETDEPVYTDAACEPSDHEHQYPQQEKSSVSLSQVEPPKGDSPVSGIASNDCSFQDISQRITI